jgi:hypothetical protein
MVGVERPQVCKAARHLGIELSAAQTTWHNKEGKIFN